MRLPSPSPRPSPARWPSPASLLAALRGLLLALSLAGWLSSPAQAQEPIEVLERGHAYEFAQRLTFTLRARAQVEIVEAKVFFQFGAFDPLNNDQPERFQPAREIDVEVVRRLQRGQIPPAQEITYWWRLRDASGNVLETGRESFIYLDRQFDWQSVGTERITVFSYDQPESFARQVLETSEAALDRLARQVGVSIEFPIKVVVYNSREDMRPALVFRGEVFEGQIVTLGTVVAEDIVILLGSDPQLEVTIFHELTHVVLAQATDNPFTAMPAWLNEGLASYNEGEVRSGYDRALASACRSDRLMSVRSLTSSTVGPEQVTLFYAQSRSLVEFLLEEHGREKMLQLLQAIREGNLIDDALEEVYGFHQDGLEALWRGWLGCPTAASGEPTPQVAEPLATPVPPAAEQAPQTRSADDPRVDALRRTLTFIVLASLVGAAAVGALMVLVLVRG